MTHRFQRLYAFLVLASSVPFAPVANAQSCAAPIIWRSDPTGSPPMGADLCAFPDSVALYCDFLDSAGKNDAIYQFTLVAGFTSTSVQVAGGTAGFNPVIFLYNGACATGSGCVVSGDTTNPLPLTGVAPGAYFLAASAAPSDATGACGAVTLASNGFIPVELQSFDID